jgi:hypothetical protein
MYCWRSSFRAIWPASTSGFIVPILHEYTWLYTYIRVLSDLCMIRPSVAPNKLFSQERSVGRSSSITEKFFVSSKRWGKRKDGARVRHSP